MKQTEKLDLILKALYEFANNGLMYNLEWIMESNNIPCSSRQDLITLANRLKDDRLIEAIFNKNGANVRLTTYGIDYVEGDSYTYRGSSVVTNNYNTTITNSSGISVVNASTNVSVNISNIGDINNKIEDLLKLIESSPEVPAEIKTEMIDCIDEMKSSLSNDKKPKHSFNALLGMANNFAGISTLAIEIGKLIFG